MSQDIGTRFITGLANSKKARADLREAIEMLMSIYGIEARGAYVLGDWRLTGTDSVVRLEWRDSLVASYKVSENRICYSEPSLAFLLSIHKGLGDLIRGLMGDFPNNCVKTSQILDFADAK